MPLIPLEDDYTDILGKAQRGLRITDAQLASRAEITPTDLASLKAGRFNEAVARRVARHLGLHPGALVLIALNKYYPAQPVFRDGFAAFNSPCGGMAVNSYLLWDHRSRQAAIIDPGTSGEKLLLHLDSEKLDLRQIFLTHTHHDHIADLGMILASAGTKTPPDIWLAASEAPEVPGAKPFAPGAIFHAGGIPLRTYPTGGHSPGGTTYHTDALSRPLAIVGDSLFAGSMGGSVSAYDDALKNNWKYIFSLPKDTVLACGHGPLTTLAQEKKHNPFFARW